MLLFYCTLEEESGFQVLVIYSSYHQVFADILAQAADHFLTSVPVD